MVKVLYGKKGMGKTKTLISTANELAASSSGCIVFIDDSNQLMFDLKHEIRFVNVYDFPIKDSSVFLGFICGIISENYDIEGIFIDGLNYMISEKVNELEGFFIELEKLSNKYNIKFYMSLNGDLERIPEYLKAYTM